MSETKLGNYKRLEPKIIVGSFSSELDKDLYIPVYKPANWYTRIVLRLFLGLKYTDHRW